MKSIETEKNLHDGMITLRKLLKIMTAYISFSFLSKIYSELYLCDGDSLKLEDNCSEVPKAKDLHGTLYVLKTFFSLYPQKTQQLPLSEIKIVLSLKNVEERLIPWRRLQSFS